MTPEMRAHKDLWREHEIRELRQQQFRVLQLEETKLIKELAPGFFRTAFILMFVGLMLFVQHCVQ